ncbi:HNH endonuclease signature motif containing protein [Nocardioides ochotonae]|uniref:HNH endonuclease signature motif containing protein n=1 Tax=Nocardioides ochotonae TaxID=2685869 RepID=UPI001409EC08|nr:HNH endonuclease signature motif containing protein [Nocardioides ochotonae]
MGLAFCSLLESVDPARLPVHGGASTQIVITIDLEALRSGLGHGTLATNGDRETPVSVGEVRRLACHAGIVPAVLGSRSEVLDLGRSSRLFSPAQRRAALVGRHTCAGQGCTIPATWCEAHHRRNPWSRGGTTDLDDLEFLCRWHHQRAHDPTYTTERLANGDVRFARRT